MERADRVTTDMVSISEAELAGEILQSRRPERDEFELGLAGRGSRPAAMTTERGLELIDLYLREHEEIQADAVPASGAPADGSLEFRIGPGRVLHLREALKIVLIDGLGLFFAFTTTSGFAALFYAWFFLSGADIVRRFMKCFENLTDPQERQVFEALFALQNGKVAEVAGTDPDDDIPAKRTRISVADKAISEHLGMGEAEVRGILRGMAARDIVTESAGLWSISFW